MNGAGKKGPSAPPKPESSPVSPAFPADGRTRPLKRTAASFIGIAITLWRKPVERSQDEIDRRCARVAMVSFAAIFFSERGDVGQVTAATMAAKFPASPIWVWLGAVGAMATKGALAASIGAGVRPWVLSKLSPLGAGLRDPCDAVEGLGLAGLPIHDESVVVAKGTEGTIRRRRSHGQNPILPSIRTAIYSGPVSSSHFPSSSACPAKVAL